MKLIYMAVALAAALIFAPATGLCDAQSSTPRTAALFKAIDAGDQSQVESLIGQGADVNGRDSDDYTPLMDAAMKGNVAISQTLLSHSANVNADEKSGGNTPLSLACFFGTTAEVKLLVDNGADVNHPGSTDGMTPLMMAVANPDAVKLLLQKGAHVNAKSKDGYTALIAAAQLGNADTETILLQNGADVNARDNKDGKTALMWACDFGMNKIPLDTYKVLVDHGAKINAKDNDGDTALSLAKQASRTQVVAYLKSIGAK